MPCGCKKGSGLGGRRRKRGGMAIGGAGMRITGAGYRKKRRRRKKRGGGIAMNTLMYGPLGTVASLAGNLFRPKVRSRFAEGIMQRAKSAAGRFSKKGSGGRFLSGATWHGYGRGSGMSISGAGLYKKRLLGRNGSGRRQI